MVTILQALKENLELNSEIFNFKEKEQVKKLDPKYYSHPDETIHQEFIKKSVELILKEAVFEGTSRENKVLEWRDPEERKELLDLKPCKKGASDDKLLQLLSDVIAHSVKTGHPYFVNQLFSSVDPYGLVGQWLTDALNPSVYTYEVSPVFTLMEETVLREMRVMVGYPNGNGDGIFCPGGSISNGYAISCARYHFDPDIKTRGVAASGRLVVFTSEDAHYSIVKMATLMGLGSDNVYLVKTDSRGKMIPQHLQELVEQTLAEGAKPFIVSATAGTTVLGAFDPINDIADICLRYNLWLHVDAAWGGGALFSARHKRLLQGIHRADSVTWNPHKLLTAPQQCSVFLTSHEGLLANCHSASATYLFQKDKFYDTKYDTGDKHIQCGRRADVLKFWFMWKAKGSVGFEAHVDKVFENAEYFKTSIQNREGFQLVLNQPECTNICFWYIPPSLRNSENDPSFAEKLNKVAPKIKERMMKSGAMMVTYQPLRNLPNFFRLVLQSSALDFKDMDYFIQTIEEFGADL